MLLLKNKNYHLLLLRLCNRLYTVPIELPSASGFEYGLYLGHWFTIGYVIPLTELLGWLFSFLEVFSFDALSYYSCIVCICWDKPQVLRMKEDHRRNF